MPPTSGYRSIDIGTLGAVGGDRALQWMVAVGLTNTETFRVNHIG